jgi:hypothetical protein
MASSLYFSFANQYSLGGGFSFPTVFVPKYKLSLCHTLIKPDLLSFPGIDIFSCGLCDNVITRFVLIGIRARLRNRVISFYYFHFFSVPLSFSVFMSILFFMFASSKQKKKKKKKSVIFHLVTLSNHFNILKRKREREREREREG